MARRNILLVNRTLYQIGIVTLFASLIWVGIGIYLTLNKPLNAEVDKKILESINPIIDQEVIKALSSRLVLELVEPTETSISANSTLNDNINQDNQQ